MLHDYLTQMIDHLILANEAQTGTEFLGIFVRQFDLMEQGMIGPGKEIIGGRADKDAIPQYPVLQDATLPAPRKIAIADLSDIKGNVAAADIDMMGDLGAASIHRLTDIPKETVG